MGCKSKRLLWPNVRFVVCQGGAFENNHGSEKVSSYYLMVFGGVVLGPVVSVVRLARPPVDAKLLLAFAIVEPMKPHVHGFSSFGLDFAFDDSVSHGVVGLEGSGGLSVT
jgi:hypothetical protein